MGALLAQHRREQDIRVISWTLEVTVDAQPMQVPVSRHLVGADDGDVVLGLTGHDAGTTAGAGVEVDDHFPPCRPLVLVFPEVVGRVVVGRLDVRVVAGQLVNDGPAFGAVMGLVGRQCLGHSRRRSRGAQARYSQSGVDGLAQSVAVGLGETDRDPEHGRVHSGDDPGRHRHRGLANLYGEHVAVGNPKTARQSGRDPNHGHPGDPRQGVGQFPQPGVVSVAAIAGPYLGEQADLELGATSLSGGQ